MRKRHNELELLHFLASAYGRRPSEVIGISDELAAINFDVAALVAGREAESRAYEEAKSKKGKGKPRPGQKLGSWRSLAARSSNVNLKKVTDGQR